MLNDALSDPLLLLRSLHDDQFSNESQTQLPARAARCFQAIFNDDDALKQIPPLDVSHPPDCYAHNSHPLVRFRAMVQDTSASPEVYLSLLRDGHLGGWGLAETAEYQGPLVVQHLREREVVWAINVPGESPFVAEHLDSESRNVSDVQMTPNTLSHKDPLLREKHVGVQIKVYDTSAPSLKPTELRTFVGFLTFEPRLWGADEKSEGAAVPTLHMLFSVKHPSTLVHFAYPVPGYTATLGWHDQSRPVSHVRDELIQWIADEALGGDSDAAEWVLLVSIARVQSRQPPLFPPSLTLSRLSKPIMCATQTPALSYVLRHILPLFVDVTLSLPLLNTRPFFPVSRDESLHSGLLQIPAGTTVLLSDTGIQDGKITETGIRNIEALRNITTSQTLDYQFPFTTPFQFHTDLSFIFLTEGKENAFIETHLNVPLKCQTSTGCFSLPEEINLPSPARLEDFRRLIGRAKTGRVTVTEEISQYIQADFARERQENKATTADDLMTRMTVARLLALSLHDTELTREVWQKAKNLDERRKQRF